MGLYNEFRALAVDLMEEFAVTASITRVTRTYDEATDTVTSETTTSLPCKAVIAPRALDAKNEHINVKTMARLNIRPIIGDRLVFGGETYTVESVEEIAPDGGAPMLYMAEVCK